MERETFFHLLARCPCFNTVRAGLFQRYEIDEPFLEWKVQAVVAFINGTSVSDIFLQKENDLNLSHSISSISTVSSDSPEDNV